MLTIKKKRIIILLLSVNSTYPCIRIHVSQETLINTMVNERETFLADYSKGNALQSSFVRIKNFKV